MEQTRIEELSKLQDKYEKESDKIRKMSSSDSKITHAEILEVISWVRTGIEMKKHSNEFAELKKEQREAVNRAEAETSQKIEIHTEDKSLQNVKDQVKDKTAVKETKQRIGPKMSLANGRNLFARLKSASSNSKGLSR